MCKSCHVVDVGIEIRSWTALQAACKRLGWTLNPECKQLRWYGEWVGDTNAAMSLLTEQQRALLNNASNAAKKTFFTDFYNSPISATISVPGCDYNIGLRYDPTGHYKVFADTWYDGGLDKHLLPINPLAQAYAIELAKITAQQQGQTITETADAEGTVHLHIGITE